MSAYRHLTRAVAVTGAVLAGACLTATPAAAADASAELARLPRMTAGGNAAALLGSVTNRTREPLPAVQVMFTIQMSGLDADEVTLGGLALAEEDGRIRAVEQINPPAPRRTQVIRHELRFLAGAPAGAVTVSMDVFLRQGGDWQRVDSARTGTTVQTSRGTPTPTAPTVQPGPADVSPGTTTQAPVAVAQPKPAADNDSALWPLYVLGLLLVGGGGAVVALLLLRRPRDSEAGPQAASVYDAASYEAPAHEAPLYEAPPYGGPGYGFTAATTDAPTIVMPAITGPLDGDSTSPESGRHRDG